ncbi:hypothetical protein B9T07_12985 [Limnospira fusiformis CCALA 023]|uniref:hypothetical protein n=1 Tax=Limnospira platensis TaxID=118562 RepID=UPI0012CE9B18|nr:hypothetical protein [Arthrospira sp. PLM2.Bin9]TVU53407.1 MAG: hypothetical protein EA414_12355 [Arthrospira sp. PLM2.Bin9]
MSSKKTFVIVAISSIAGGIIGTFLASPVSYSLYEPSRGRGFYRNCQPFGDLICNEMRNREMYSGQSFRTRSVLDSRATLERQLMYGGIGVFAGLTSGSVLAGVLSQIMKDKTETKS